MKTHSGSVRSVRLLAAALALAGATIAHAADRTDPAAATNPYSYFYKGQSVGMKPSATRIAILGARPDLKALAAGAGGISLETDPLTEAGALRDRQVTILRAPLPPTKGSQQRMSPADRILSQTKNLDVQPVFEQGEIILIPTEEIVVGFKEETPLAKARDWFAAQAAGQGITDVREHRPNTFIVSIDHPRDGRCYAVAQALARMEAIAFAEPNHLLIPEFSPLNNKALPVQESETLGAPVTLEGSPASSMNSLSALAGAATWVTLASLDFESSTFPPSGWLVQYYTGYTAASWNRTAYRKHAGSYSLYCAGSGSAAVQPPGPAPLKMAACFNSPAFNLSVYEEVYVELWFFAKNDLYNTYLFDYPAVLVHAGTNGAGIILGSAANGDCTADATTQNGWRRMLYRVPPAYRTSSAWFEFRYRSDSVDAFEGAYLDDIRIVATADVDTSPIGNDTYGARIWELKNSGQIAGLGNDEHDLHVTEAWELTAVSSDVIVAVIDQGVDLTHPDLNLVTGYDANGAVGGGPKSSSDNHGTAVAGNIGAIRNNNRGVIGTAPGVKILPIYWGSTYTDMANALALAVQKGARIINNSWGWYGSPSAVIESAVRAALSDNVVVLFAAGNGPDRSPYVYNVVFPGSLTADSDVICVGASSPTDEYKGTASSDGEYSWGSSYLGTGPDVVAPGPWSYTTDRTGANGYNNGSDLADADYTPDFSGTSSATPKTAGIVALMLSANPYLTPAQVKAMLKATATDVAGAGEDDQTGAGRVNAYAAVQAAIASRPNQPPVVSAFSPAASPVYVKTNGTTRLSVTAGDPDNNLLQYIWSVDGATMGGATGSNLAFAAAGYSFGPHLARVDVTDGHGGTAQREWQILVGTGDTNLVAYWTFDNGSSADQSGWARNLQIQGNTTFVGDGVKEEAIRIGRPE